ncbi:hypothetical protein C7C45_30595 [Micromonospora arborensis]|uniref:Uncharacterized protein n=1 Tax=Micromonospora arborensis TaxID=2116518 RepID=A0A318NAS9_9ACTN|nr:hypothetical protein [Micromonospora arborensis]PYC64307.1 hypothetical protein C7C45_30595 [Micromonospora arborensis]
MRVVVKRFVVVMALAGLAACGGAPTAAEAPTGGRETPRSAAVTGTPTIQSAWTSCAVDAPIQNDGRPLAALALTRLGTDFTVATAVHCQLEPKRRADGGEDLVLTEGRATDVTALLAALRLPDDTTTVEACTLEMPWVPNLLLLDAQGRWTRIGLPVNACGKPRPEVTEAVRGLRLTTVSEKVVREIVSAGAAASGCNQEWSDVLATETGDPRLLPRPGRVPLPPQVRLCVYRVPTQQQGTPQPAGTFEYGLLLPQHRRAAIEQTLTTLRPAEQCSDAADQFAALQDATITGDVVYVELDHCRRVLATPLYGPPILAQADAALIELLSR